MNKLAVNILKLLPLLIHSLNIDQYKIKKEIEQSVEKISISCSETYENILLENKKNFMYWILS